MTGKRVITFIVLMMLIFIAVRFLPGCGEGLEILTKGPGGSATEDWEDWSYRRSVTINNSGTAMTDYQVNVTLDGTFDYGKALPDGSDIRFNYNGTSLSYWIEEWNNGGNSSIWVKVPSLPGGNTDTTIYLYYGNADQTAASNFDNTFTKNSGFSGLVAQWHMDEGSGTVISDSSGNINSGTISGAAWIGTDGGGWYDRSDVKFSTGASLVFDSVNDYVTVPDDASLDVGEITIAAWVKTSEYVVTPNQFVVSKWTESGNQRSYSLGIINGRIRFYTSSDGTSVNQHFLETSSVLADDRWYHISVTSDIANKKIYIDGIIDITISSGPYNILTTGTSDLYIGMYDLDTFFYYKGTIDEVSIYNRALSAEEIEALSQRRKYSSAVGLPSLGAEEIVP